MGVSFYKHVFRTRFFELEIISNELKQTFSTSLGPFFGLDICKLAAMLNFWYREGEKQIQNAGSVRLASSEDSATVWSTETSILQGRSKHGSCGHEPGRDICSQAFYYFHAVTKVCRCSFPGLQAGY